MRKYASSGTKWTNVIYFVAAWHLIGYVGYKAFYKNREKEDEEWKDMSSAQQYMSLMTKEGEKVKHMSLSGISLNQTETTVDEFLKPKALPERPVSKPSEATE